jgi:hypothetical protein
MEVLTEVELGAAAGKACGQSYPCSIQHGIMREVLSQSPFSLEELQDLQAQLRKLIA